MTNQLPNLATQLFDCDPATTGFGDHKPRILLFYGSTRERSYSFSWWKRPHACWSALALRHGYSTLPGDVPVEHPEVQALLDLTQW